MISTDNFLRHYTVGEKRKIEIQIIPNNKDDIVVISSATYNIIKSGQTIQSGNCDIDPETKIVGFLFEANNIGRYTARFSVTVPPEIINTDVICAVSE